MIYDGVPGGAPRSHATQYTVLWEGQGGGGEHREGGSDGEREKLN